MSCPAPAATTPPRTVTFTYDMAGDLIEVEDVNGGITSFTYDGDHRLETMRMPEHDGDTSTVPDPEWINVYDGADRVISQTDPIGRTTLFDYTTTPGSTIITDPENNVETQEYEDWLLVSVTRGSAHRMKPPGPTSTTPTPSASPSSPTRSTGTRS